MLLNKKKILMGDSKVLLYLFLIVLDIRKKGIELLELPKKEQKAINQETF